MKIVYFCVVGRNSIKKERLHNPKKKLAIIEDLIIFYQDVNNSLANSNMDEIAKGVNRSKATLYKYYKSKEEMVNDLVDYKVQEISKFVLFLHDETLSFVKRYELSFQILENNISDISNEFISDLKNVFPKIYEKIKLLIELAVHELAKFYETGMKKGVFNSLNAKLLSQNDFSIFIMLTDPQFLKDNNLTMQQAFKDFYDIRCKGLLV